MAALLAGMTGLYGPAIAADAAFPQFFVADEEPDNIFQLDLVVEHQVDHIFDSGDPDAELTDAFATIEAAIEFRPVSWFLVHTDITSEPVFDATDDRFFYEDQGTYFETLYGAIEVNGFSVFGGKVNPAFGTAWDVTPGIYGVDFAEDYEITERIGIGGSVEVGGEAGTFVFTGTTFFADTTFLSESTLTENRGRTDLDDGGPSNTESFESFSFTLDGADIAALPGFSFHGGVRFQEPGTGDTEDETGVVFGVIQTIELGEEQTIDLNAEIAHFDNYENGENNRTYFTVGGAYTFGPWNAALAYTRREIDDGPVGTNFSDDLFQASVGREIPLGFTLDVGYKYAEEEDVESHFIGALLVREFSFAVPRRGPAYVSDGPFKR